LGGIGKIYKKRTERLYKHLLPNAEKIVVRDKDSLDIARKLNPENTVLYEDFAQGIIEKAKHTPVSPSSKYILININKKSVNEKNIQKIINFCAQYPINNKIFFPCDMSDDKYCFSIIKTHIPDLKLYDRTKKSLSESLSLFYYADGGV